VDLAPFYARSAAPELLPDYTNNEVNLDFIAAVVLGIAMGITEFSPVSSLGHSLFLEALFNFPQSVSVGSVQNARNVIGFFIEGGAVLAVLVYYARDLLGQARRVRFEPQTRRLWLNVLIAFVPVGVVGVLFNKWIQGHLFAPWIVGVALIAVGILFLLVEGRKYEPTTLTLEAVTPRQALLVGLAQIGALIPGVSRSGSTILGGLLSGLSREVATSFTFYLFIPTLVSAVGYEMFSQVRDQTFPAELLPYLLVAFAVAFVVSLFTIRFLLRYVSQHDFRPFGVYRIIVGALILVLVMAKII
jgi:undecaprenyl-diphosphatase